MLFFRALVGTAVVLSALLAYSKSKTLQHKCGNNSGRKDDGNVASKKLKILVLLFLTFW